METEAEWLLSWYDQRHRVLPWRGISDPYAIWVSETMLQQTRVETVLAYYQRFLSAFPTMRSLAEADDAEAMKLWEGLGYYRRVRNLLRGVRQVVEDYGGQLPHSAAELERIHGIGPYTAGAIASIAFGERTPAVDGNVIRVITRFRGIRDNAAAPSTQRRIREEALTLIPAERPGDFNQAMMDLGAMVCTPGTPDCDHCPLAPTCDALAAGDADELPLLPQRQPPRPQDMDVFLVMAGHRALMRRREETLLQGLWVFPLAETHRPLSRVAQACHRLTGVSALRPRFLGTARHVFTHRVWQMNIYALDAEKADAPEGWRFVTADEMDALAVPTAMKVPVQFARAMMADHPHP